MPPPDSAGFVLHTPSGPVLVPPLALAVVLGVLAGLLLALWAVQRRRARPR